MSENRGHTRIRGCSHRKLYLPIRLDLGLGSRRTGPVGRSAKHPSNHSQPFVIMAMQLHDCCHNFGLSIGYRSLITIIARLRSIPLLSVFSCSSITGSAGSTGFSPRGIGYLPQTYLFHRECKSNTLLIYMRARSCSLLHPCVYISRNIYVV
jgi:hypothetical protein